MVNVTGGTPPYSYLWSDAMGQTTATCSNLEQGIYTVTVSDSNLCTYEESFYVNGTTAVSEIDILEKIALFPNPTNGLTTLDLTLEESAALEVSIYSVLGQEIFYQNFAPSKALHTQLDLRTASNGIYFVRIQVAGGQLVQRLVLNK